MKRPLIAAVKGNAQMGENTKGPHWNEKRKIEAQAHRVRELLMNGGRGEVKKALVAALYIARDEYKRCVDTPGQHERIRDDFETQLRVTEYLIDVLE